MKRFRTAGRIFELMVFAAIASGALTLGATSSFGATPSTPYRTVATDSPLPADTSKNSQCDPNGDYPNCVASNFGERISAAGDVTGDGVSDVFTSSYSQDVPASTFSPPIADNNAGMVTLISGATQRVVWNVTPEPQADASFGVGFAVSVTGDVTGDGKEDVTVGSPNHDVSGNVNQGRAYQLNGQTGAVIRVIDNPYPQKNGNFGARIGAAGDVTGDGVPDILIGATGNDFPTPGCSDLTPVPAGCRNGQGQAFVINGATGAKVRDINLPAADQGGCAPTGGCSFGGVPQGVGDVNGDGVTDHTIGAYAYRGTGGPFTGRAYLFSGRDGQLLARIDPPGGQQFYFFGLEDPDRNAPGDLNGDGVPDLYFDAFGAGSSGGHGGGGRAWTFDGASTVATGTGQVLYELIDPQVGPNRAFGWAHSKTDYNKDGRPDLFVSGLSDQNSAVYVIDGRDGRTELKRFSTPAADLAADPTGSIGWSSRAPGDLNGDCEPDYVAGAPYQDVGAQTDQGRVYFFLSNGPSACPSTAPPPTYPGPGAGSAAFAGCPALTANVIRGTAASNRITGTVRADRIFAGTGDDVVDALPGDDCVDLGTGNDRGQGGLGKDLMLGGIGKDRMSGSSGNDTLRGNSGNDRLDAGRGNDRVFGDAGNDTLLGSFGNDVLHGVSGKDVISGSRGRDRINGGSGSDKISGGSSNDRISGDAGNDRINGNSGKDSVKGNSGADRINVRDGQRDKVNCGSGRDTVLADRKDIVAHNCERVSRR